MSDFDAIPVTVPPAADPAGRPFWSWMEVGMFLALVLASWVFFGLIGGLAGFVAGGNTTATVAVGLAVQFIAYLVGFIGIALMFRARYGMPFWRSLGWRMDWWLTLPMLFGGLVLAIVVAFGSVLLGAKPGESPMEKLLHDPATVAVLAVLGTTAGPLAEELMFRGLVQPLLVRRLGAIAGILLTAAPFGLLHGSQYGWSWQHIVLILAAGTAFGWVRHLTGSTALATLMHAGYNATFFVLLAIQRSFV